jgi:uncharacterized membrane protein
VTDRVEGDGTAAVDGAAPEDNPGVERLLALSDGVVAIALTLLVLQLVVPRIAGVSTKDTHSAHYLWTQLSRTGGDQFTAYLVSFYVIAQFWLAHHRVFRSIQGHNEGLAWWNFAFLFTITLMPFTSDLLGRFGDNPLAIDIFALNLFLASLATQGVGIYARRRHLVKYETSPQERRSGYFRFGWVGVVVLTSATLAWFSPRWAVLSWLLLLPAQRVSDWLASRFPGAPPAAVTPA